MLELEKLGKVMSVVMDNCDNCPLEKYVVRMLATSNGRDFLNRK